MQQLKAEAKNLVRQITIAKNTGYMSKMAEAEKAVDMSARLLVGVLQKLEVMQAELNQLKGVTGE